MIPTTITLTYGAHFLLTRDNIRDGIRSILRPFGPTYFVNGAEHRGEWTGEDGITHEENSGVIVAHFSDGLTDREIASIRKAVRKLAQRTGQEAIGFIPAHGETLIWA